MKTTITKILPLALSMGVLISSCSDDLSVQDDATPEAVVKAQASTNLEIPSTGHFDLETSGLVKDFDLKLQLSEVVEPSECGPTPFNEVANYYNDLLIDGFIAAWDGNPDAIGIILEDYFAINQIAAAYEGKNTDYFGEDGEYTNYVKNRVRSLEKFWDMADLIEVNGQHTETLEDLDFIRYIYENYSTATPEDIDYILEIAETFNTNSDQIPENPFFASDGFATFDRTIVVGDGIVTFLEDTGLDPKVVWSSILAHEWGHQIQFLKGPISYFISSIKNLGIIFLLNLKAFGVFGVALGVWGPSGPSGRETYINFDPSRPPGREKYHPRMSHKHPREYEPQR